MPPPLSAEHVGEGAAGIEPASEQRPYQTVRRSAFYPFDKESVKHILADQPSSSRQRRDNQIDVRRRVFRILAWIQPNISERSFPEGSQLELGADCRGPAERLQAAFPIQLRTSVFWFYVCDGVEFQLAAWCGRRVRAREGSQVFEALSTSRLKATHI